VGEIYLQEYTSVADSPLRIDRRAGVIRGVKLLGPRSRNGRVYQEEALREAVPLYEGAKVNVNHPNGHPAGVRDYRDRIGILRHVRYEEGRGLFGDLLYNPKHALAEQLAWDAEHLPSNVGLSHNVLARTSSDGSQTIVEAILRVFSVDLVADPATTGGLFEWQGVAADCMGWSGTAAGQQVRRGNRAGEDPVLPESVWERLSVEELRQKRPDLLEEACQSLRESLAQAETNRQELARQLARAERTLFIFRTLAEFGLPLPGSPGWDEESLGGSFWELLHQVSEEAEVRRLVGRRAEQMGSRHGLGGLRTVQSRPAGIGGPKEQQLREFLQAICPDG
jgi:hypothetical protein